MRRRPGVLRYPPGAASALCAELGLEQSALRRRTAALLDRADAGRPLRREEAAQLERALIGAALGPQRFDHRSGAYNGLKAQIRRRLPAAEVAV